MDIPSFLKPDFAASPCCWSHSMRTRVWVIKSFLFHAPPWQLRQGVKSGFRKLGISMDIPRYTTYIPCIYIK
jgi:hypothetical protein